MKNFKKLIKEAYLGNPLNEDRYLKNQDSYIRVTEPRFRKDKNNPNFLFGYINYDTGPGVSIALGKETMAGQIKRLSSMEAMRRMKSIAVQLEDAFNIEDIEITDLKNGVVELFAVSDDFIDMDPKSELSMAMLNETAGTFGDGVTDEIKAKYNKAAMDEYGKPFAELDIFQKQEIMKAIVKYTGPEFDTDYTKYRKEMSDYVNEELLKEFTVPGGNYRDSYANSLPEEQLTSPDEYELFMEMFPRGEASRILMDPNRKKLFDQHLEWTKDSQYNNVFQHMQYHDVEYEGEPYRIHQTQYYNTNYKDFRNPSYTELMISKDGKRMGTYLVDTKEYIKDLKDLEVKDRVMEGTCGYGEDGKIDPENTDKLKPAGSEMSDEELHKLVKDKLKKNFLDEAEDRLNESINEGKFPDSFTVKDILHYTPEIDGKPKKLYKGTYKLKNDKGDTAVYFNQAFKSEIEIDNDDIFNFKRLKSNFKVEDGGIEAELKKNYGKTWDFPEPAQVTKEKLPTLNETGTGIPEPKFLNDMSYEELLDLKRQSNYRKYPKSERDKVEAAINKKKPINEIESGDIVVYNHDDHTVQRIEDDELGVRIYIRPNERSYYGGRKDTFWVKPTDIETKEEFLDRMMRDQIQHDKETLRKERGLEESVKMPSQEEVDKFFTDTQNEMHYLASKPVMGQKGDRVRSEIEPWDEYDLSNWNALVRKAKARRGMSDEEIGDEVRRLLKRNFMKEDDEVNLNVSNANDIADEEEANSGVIGETKGFNFKQMVKEALTPNNLK